MYQPNLKSAALPVPEIIGVLSNFVHCSPRIRPFSLFSTIVTGFCSDSRFEYRPNLKSSFTRFSAVATDRLRWGQPDHNPIGLMI